MKIVRKIKQQVSGLSVPTQIIFYLLILQVVTFLIVVVGFVIAWVVWNFFGPHFPAPVDNEDWLWNLVGAGFGSVLIVEFVFWIFGFYKLFRYLRKKTKNGFLIWILSILYLFIFIFKPFIIFPLTIIFFVLTIYTSKK